MLGGVRRCWEVLGGVGRCWEVLGGVWGACHFDNGEVQRVAAMFALHARFNHCLCLARDVAGLSTRRRCDEAVHINEIEERHVRA